MDIPVLKGDLLIQMVINLLSDRDGMILHHLDAWRVDPSYSPNLSPDLEVGELPPFGFQTPWGVGGIKLDPGPRHTIQTLQEV